MGFLQLIKRASMTGQGDTETILHTERTSILDIAVDWLAQNIYWIDYDRSTIEMARVNGSSKLIIVYKNLYKPKYMVLDPAQG